jgi:hypothetical protein
VLPSVRRRPSMPPERAASQTAGTFLHFWYQTENREVNDPSRKPKNSH